MRDEIISSWMELVYCSLLFENLKELLALSLRLSQIVHFFRSNGEEQTISHLFLLVLVL